jgi:Cu(I)/Ag(I) efflux system membrane fusion protein
VASLRIGQEASVQVEAFPGETFDGRIGFINEFVHEPSRTIHTHVHTKNPSGKLMPGMYADARVEMRLSAGGQPVKPEGLDEYICKHHPHAQSRVKQEEDEKVKVCAIDGMKLTHFSEFGYVSEEDAKPPLVIPNTAPLLTGKRAVVYVLDEKASGQDPNTGEMMYAYELREVTLGPETERYYIVREGLEEGEQVVYQGAFKIDSELQIRGEPSMMYPEADGKSKSGGHDHH